MSADPPAPPAPPPPPRFPPWSRTGGVFALTIALVSLAAFVPKPWGVGTLLDPRPDLEGLGRGGPLPEQAPAEQQTVATVQLPSDAGDDADDPEAARLEATREAMAALCEELGPAPVVIERPCLEEREGVCTHRALDGFFEQLYAVATRTTERPVRWTQLGDSMTAWVDAPTRFRELMQTQFGDAGIGAILPTDPGHARELQAVERDGRGWDIRTAPFKEDPQFGLSGSVFRGGKTTVRNPSPVERVGILAAGEGRVQIQAGEQRYDTPLRQGVAWVALDEEATELQFEPDPDAAIAGFVLERPRPGVLVDNLGVVSMRADQLLKVDDATWVQQARGLDPDVIVFSYGAKSPHEPAWHREDPPEAWLRDYERDYTTVLARSRQVDADCLVLSLMTRAEPDPSGKRMQVFASVEPTIAAQRRAAQAHGCAFFDSYAATGGPEGANDWYWHEPRWLGFDLLHLTPEGYHRYAELLYVSLMHAFREWLDERAVR